MSGNPRSPRILRPPLWARRVLSLGVGAGLLVALVLFVSHHNSDSPAPESPAAAARANREAAIIVAQDQAPHVVSIASGSTAIAALTRAITADMAHRIATGQIDGPLQHSACRRAGGGMDTVAFRCTLQANGLNYAFLAVAHSRSRQLTYCKRDPPPVPSQDIPVSRRCRA